MYKVEVTGDAGYSFKVRSRDYEFTVDTNGKGITPPDTLLASLGSCIGVYIRKYEEHASLGIGAFTVTAEAEFSKEPPVCFKHIRVSIDLHGVALDERRKKALLDFIRNCPVHHTLEAQPVVDIALC